MAQSNNVSAGQDATAQQYNNLRADLYSAHHQDPLGVKIVNADIDNAAAISLSKLAALTANRALATNGSGLIVVSAVTLAELEYLSGLASRPVANSGNETINGIKTFGSIPVLPGSDPSSDNQAARKGYVDGKFGISRNGSTTLSYSTYESVKSFSHGLGRVPKKITLIIDGRQSQANFCLGFWGSNGQASSSVWVSNQVRLSASDVGYIYVGNAGNKTFTVSADASNITITISPPNGDAWSCSIGVTWSAEA